MSRFSYLDTSIVWKFGQIICLVNFKFEIWDMEKYLLLRDIDSMHGDLWVLDCFVLKSACMCQKQDFLKLSFINLRVGKKEKGGERERERAREQTCFAFESESSEPGNLSQCPWHPESAVVTWWLSEHQGCADFERIPSKALSLFCLCCIRNSHQMLDTGELRHLPAGKS